MNGKNKRVGFFNRTVAIVAAVLIHAVLLFFLIANFNQPQEAAVAKDADEIDTIIATTISADEIKNQKKKIQKADDDRKKKAEERRKKEKRELDKLKEEKEKAKKELEETKQKRIKEEQKRVEDEKKRVKEEQKRIEEEKAIALKRKKEKELKDKQEKERKQKEADKKKREAEELRKKQKAEEDRKVKEEAERLEKEAAEAEKKRREDRLQSLQNELSKELSDESSEEKIANQQIGARNTTTLFNKYVALIGDKVKANFNAPLGTPVGREAVVNVRLDSVGRVQSTKIVKSSGDFAFDRAVEVAIARSEPLPMPPESDPANARLQNINFPFRYRGS